MGLDMYMRKRHYLKNWEHNPASSKVEIVVKKGGKVIESINDSNIEYIDTSIAYWRKANAIHSWFVKNVQGGKDDCGEYEVSREQLQRLMNICNTILDKAIIKEGKIKNGYSLGENLEKNWNYVDGKYISNVEEIQKLLPTQDGFFFGSQEYDEYYLEDLEMTVDMLRKALQDGDDIGGEFIYSSSW